MKKLLVLFSVITLLAGLIGTANANLLVSASLRNGNYGGGTTPDPYFPSNDPSQTCPGINNSSNGVIYSSPKALINWNFGAADADSLRYEGTICFTATFYGDLFNNSNIYLLSDNKGFDTFANGQSSFAAWAYATDPGKPDDQINLRFKFWVNNVWYGFASNTPLSVNQAHQLGFTWGGPFGDLEIWADGKEILSGNFPPGVTLPWGTNYGGTYIAATNIGLGDDHERGVKSGYGSATGVLFADLQIWNEYRLKGGTSAVPLPPSALLLGSGLLGLAGWRRLKKG